MIIDFDYNYFHDDVFYGNCNAMQTKTFEIWNECEEDSLPKPN